MSSGKKATPVLGPVAGPVEPESSPTPVFGQTVTGPESTSSSTPTSGLLYRKAWGRKPPDLTSQNTRLMAENSNLRTKLDFADSKIKALIIFASKCDNALWLLGEKLGLYIKDYTSITNSVDDAVEELRDQFPSLQSLITRHKYLEDLRETTNMANWIAQGDHIQMESEIRLRQDSGSLD